MAGPPPVAARAALLPLLLALGCSGEPEALPAPVADGPIFVDATATSGLDFLHETGAIGNRELPETVGAGAALLDHDRDGDLDVYLVQSGTVRRPDGSERSVVGNELFANAGDATFTRVPDAAGAADRGYGQGAAAGDVDGDGWVDLLSLNWGPNLLFRNREGRFVWDKGALKTVDEWSVSATFFDAEGDGDLDLYVVNYVRSVPAAHLAQGYRSGFPAYPHPKHFAGEVDRYYRNDGNGALDVKGCERVVAADGAPGKGLGVVATDFDLDGFADLYVANDSTPNMLLHNQGDGSFVDVGVRGGAAFNAAGEAESGMGVDAGDFDGDGDFDLVVTNLSAETNTLYVNRARRRKGGESVEGRGGFTDFTDRARLGTATFPMVGFGILFVDANRDGLQDLVVANGHIIDNIDRIQPQFVYRQRNQLFLGDGAGEFVEPTFEQLGTAFAIEDVTRGLAAGDLDRDGDLDLLFTNNGGRPQLLLGNLVAGAWLALTLEGPPGNSQGLGANVFLEHADGGRSLHRIESGRSYASACEPSVHVGLRSPVVAVEAQWPGGRRERWSGRVDFTGRRSLAFGTGTKIERP